MPPSYTRWHIISLLVALLIGAITGRYWLSNHIASERLISSEEMVQIVDADLSFLGRVDTGATVTSINAVDIEVINADTEKPKANVGKTVRFTLVNAQGEKHPLERPIIKVRYVHSSDCGEWRYYVNLTIKFRGHEQRLLVNLNDRSKSGQKLLLGRDWLKQGYIVDIGLRAE